jgi:hypothetical protein
MSRKVIFVTVVLILAAPLFSQSNEIIDMILAESELSAGSAAYLVVSLDPAGTPPADQAEAFMQLTAADDLSRFGIQTAEDMVSLGLFAYLLQQEMQLPKGIGSSLFAGPRYALRDLKFLALIQGRGAPSDPVDGERALRIIGRALAETEERL